MVNRYVMEVDSNFGYDAKVVPVPDPRGQWVRVSDYESNLAQARTEIEELKRQLWNMTEAAKDKMVEIERLTVERDFFLSEIKLRNRIPSTNDTAADLLRRAEKAEAELAQATATVELVNSNNLTLAAELTGWKQTARQMEAERDEALAQVAMAYEESAKAAIKEANNWNPNNMAGVCGFQCGYTIVREIRALTPADAQAALEAYGREKVWEGMHLAATIAGQKSAVLPHYPDFTRGYAQGRSSAREAILAEMEKLK